MPMKKRNYSQEWRSEKEREHEKPRRAARARARREYDSKGIDRNGKDIDHKTPLSVKIDGANKKSNLRLVSPSTNRSFARNSDGSMKRGANGKSKAKS
jgi:hypothetical protein